MSAIDYLNWKLAPLGRKARNKYLIEKSLPVEWQGYCDSVAVSDDEEDFIAAYNDVGSCMKGKGKDIFIKTKNEVSIFVAIKNGKIVARTLIDCQAMTFTRVYGEQHVKFTILLEALGFAGGLMAYPEKRITERSLVTVEEVSQILECTAVWPQVEPSTTYGGGVTRKIHPAYAKNLGMVIIGPIRTVSVTNVFDRNCTVSHYEPDGGGLYVDNYRTRPVRA